MSTYCSLESQLNSNRTKMFLITIKVLKMPLVKYLSCCPGLNVLNAVILRQSDKLSTDIIANCGNNCEKETWKSNILITGKIFLHWTCILGSWDVNLSSSYLFMNSRTFSVSHLYISGYRTYPYVNLYPYRFATYIWSVLISTRSTAPESLLRRYIHTVCPKIYPQGLRFVAIPAEVKHILQGYSNNTAVTWLHWRIYEQALYWPAKPHYTVHQP